MADIDFTPDELAPDPNEPSGRVLIGILGESPNPDSVVLYLDLGLQKRYEIPKDAILGRQKIPAAQSPLGVDASMIRVHPGAALRLQLDQPRNIEDEFLAGDFTAPGSFTPTLPSQFPRPPVLTGTNWSAIDVCPTIVCPFYTLHYICRRSRWCP